MSDAGAKKGVLAFGGDVGIGRYMNFMAPNMDISKILGTLSAFKESDLSIVNLECAVSSKGQAGIHKGEMVPFYFRARPEMLGILTEAQIDVVSVANNHSLDYGLEAFLNMLDLLEEAGIDYAGGGKNIEEAREPVVRWVGDVAVAFIGIDFTMPHFAAEKEQGGNFYLSPKRANEWFDDIYKYFYQARANAHLVLPVVHWGNNFETEPSENVRYLAEALISAGADGVLGASAHVLHGVEIMNDCPVIYDAGNLLFDFREERNVAGVFQLYLNQNGIEEIKLSPTRNEYCYTVEASPEIKQETLTTFQERSKKLGTEVQIYKDQAFVYNKPKPKERHFELTPPELKRKVLKKPKPIEKLPDGFTVKAVPEDASIQLEKFGPVEMIGLKLDKSKFRQMEPFWIESYWKLSEGSVDKDYVIVSRFLHEDAGANEVVWDSDHDPCDWLWPTTRWEQGVIYKDRFLARPDVTAFLPGKYDLVTGVVHLKTNEQYIRKTAYQIVVE